MATSKSLVFLYLLFMLLLCCCRGTKSIETPTPVAIDTISVPVILPVIVPVYDSDKDGITDDKDKCPNQPGPAKYMGCPVPDTDMDGVNDEEDKCPTIAGDSKYRGCPPPAGDTDGNGVVDNSNHEPTNVRPDLRPENLPQENLPPLITPSEQDPFRNIAVRNASIAYSYFKRIRYKETKDIRVLLKLNTSRPMVEAALNTMETEQQAEIVKESDTNVVKSLTIRGYDSIYISLEYDTADFVVTPVLTEEAQLLDSVNGNSWHWQVKAITEKPTSKIIIKVIAKDTAKGSTQKDERQIAVTILIDNLSGLRKAWIWIIENPQYSIPSIIVPLIAFLFSRRKKKEEKEEEKEKPPGK
ncbi:MAG: OmpA family protein [Ferruginibacter sp.]|nr:OmpA family protein [Ferruginibacter sp.]